MTQWSKERVEQLAPDAASAKAGLGLAKPVEWPSLGRQDQIVWGECQGSGAKPYQVRVALEDLGYRCTCPSRKQPCKHTLGLLFLLAGGTPFPDSTPPPFVEEWLANRSRRAEAKVAREAQPAAPPDPEAQARRQEKRESRVLAGLDQLESWLADVMTQGLASARVQPPAFWSQMAARLVDAQAPGLATRVRELASAALSGEQWSERLMVGLARLQLLIDAYRRLNQLPGPLAAEVRTRIGWTQKQEELLTQPGVLDCWQVIGRRQSLDDTLRVQYTWLHGAASAEIGLVLEFAVGRQPLPASFLLGQVLDAELVFFEAALPYRALVKPRGAAQRQALGLPRASDVLALQNAFAAALAKNPWLDRWPAVVGPVIPSVDTDQVILADALGRRLPVRRSFRQGWSLVALAGGEPVSLFGEWDGFEFDPVSVEHGGALYSMGEIGGLPVLARAV
ncbi:MAG: SWIM zinc finger family protein [Proteobacteria bacterium]|nr:SWIM zinc finger family protein [Pseudomonadota bacterium]